MLKVPILFPKVINEDKNAIIEVEVIEVKLLLDFHFMKKGKILGLDGFTV
jgi:hypothetical protein